MRLDGKVSVIAGASRGIGKLMAEEFAAAGSKVVIGARREEVIKAMADEIAGAGHEALAVRCDVTSRADCKNLIDAAVEKFGRVDVLANCAAMSGPQKLISELEPDEWDEVVATNLTSIYLTTHYATKHMIEQGDGGAIVNISAFTGKRPLQKRVPYASTKMGLVGLTRTVALEMGPYKIRCNSISPGPVQGERVDEVIGAMSKSTGKTEDEVREVLLSWSPLHAMAEEIDIVRMALFLCSDWGKHMTGQDINITAGIVMY